MKPISDLMKSTSLKRLLALTLAYLLILYGAFVFFTSFQILTSDDVLLFFFFLIPFFFFPLYILLYKRPWVIILARIIFSITAVVLLYENFSLLDASDLLDWEALTFLTPLFLAIVSLLHLYKNEIKNWLIFLRSKPFMSFKNRLQITRQDGLLFILAIIIIHLVDWNTLIFERWFDWITLGPLFISLLIPLYLLLNRAPLKSMINILIIFSCTFLMLQIVDYIFGYGWGAFHILIGYPRELLILMAGAYVIFFSKDYKPALESQAL
jgi:hypothetical protein